MKHAALALWSGLFFSGLGTAPSDAQIVPVALDNSSFTDDAIVESNGTAISADLSGNSVPTSYVLVTADYAEANSTFLDPTGALPQDGTITNSSTGAVFQLQPYDESNVLVVNNGSATIALAPSAQASYSELSFLVSNLTSTRRSSAVSFTLNYADGSSTTVTTGSVVPILTSAPTSPGTAAITLDSYLDNGTYASAPIYLDEYDFSLAPSSEILQSITVNSGSDQLDVYAVSGIDPTPEPRTWVLLLAGLGVLGLAARRARLRA